MDEVNRVGVVLLDLNRVGEVTDVVNHRHLHNRQNVAEDGASHVNRAGDPIEATREAPIGKGIEANRAWTSGIKSSDAHLQSVIDPETTIEGLNV